jgi:hypothetical protein
MRNLVGKFLAKNKRLGKLGGKYMGGRNRAGKTWCENWVENYRAGDIGKTFRQQNWAENF